MKICYMIAQVISDGRDFKNSRHYYMIFMVSF